MFSSQNSQVSNDAVFVEDVMSTFLYTGNASTQSINNGIDLAGKGGLVWGKNRDANWSHYLADTAQGTGKFLQSNTTSATQSDSTSLTAFNANGFSIGNAGAFINNNGVNYASWTFRKQPKFFDVVTYTGTGSDPLTLNHNLQSVPGCIIIKCTSTASNWRVHSTALDMTLTLNTTNAGFSPDGLIKNLTSSTFQVNNSADVNSSGQTYVAYLFAHNAGGFGLTGTDNVISCGSFTTDGSGNATGNLGYEPQWMMTKNIGGASNWQVQDTMRGWNLSQLNTLAPNTSSAEAAIGSPSYPNTPTATGFQISGAAASATFIYIAIRRGPMKVPTDATKVFKAVSRAGTNATAQVTGVGFPPDLVISKSRTTTFVPAFYDKLRGPLLALRSSGTNAETSNAGSLTTFNQDGISVGDDASLAAINYSGTYINYFLERAPSFFDEVCYTGTGSITTVTHNLGVVPELMIVKGRTGTSSVDYWAVYSTATGNTKALLLNDTSSALTSTRYWNDTTPTSSVFTLGDSPRTNGSGTTYVAYLFATCAGVSKVFSFTGTGLLQTINCGFTSGARFVLVKRTDSTGDWYVWDSARGISSSTDPYLLLNSTAAEVTSTNWVDTTSTGFQVTAASGNNVNINGATYIGLAIA